MFNDFNAIFNPLFGAEVALKKRILQALADGPLTGAETSRVVGIGRNGRLAGLMRDLAEGGFVSDDLGKNPETGALTSAARAELVTYRDYDANTGSNAICYDGETSTAEYENPYPAYLTNGTLTVQLNWDSSLVPQGAARALLEVGSAAPCVSQRLYPRQFTEVTKPANSISFTLFESETPPRDDDIRVSLAFVSGDGTKTNAAYTTYCQLSKGSFGQARVLTAPANSYWWTQLTSPLDMHIETAWLDVSLTYASVSNLTEGVCYQGIYPFDGPIRETGVLHLDKAFAGPGCKKELRLFGGDIKYFDMVFHGSGLMLLFR